MKMNFVACIFRGPKMDDVAGYARVAEESGFSHLAFADVPNLSRDEHAMMTVAALSPDRIRIGQGVTDPATFHPVAIANATRQHR